MKLLFLLFIPLSTLLIGCEPQMVSHIEHLENVAGLKHGSKVVNEDMETIGKVTQLFDDDGVIMKVELSYLRNPAAKFSTIKDEKGATVVLASYPD